MPEIVYIYSAHHTAECMKSINDASIFIEQNIKNVILFVLLLHITYSLA